MTITCIHMTSDMAENCPNCNPAISTAIEAPAQEPVADVREAIAAIFAEDDPFVGIGQDSYAKADRVLALTTPPDHLALVAAAYRDAAEASDCGCEKNKSDCMKKKGFVSYCYRDGAADVSRRTPADAEAHLTALLRAEYERGVREAAVLFDPISIAGETDKSRLTLDGIRSAILALLTQEGR